MNSYCFTIYFENFFSNRFNSITCFINNTSKSNINRNRIPFFSSCIYSKMFRFYKSPISNFIEIICFTIKCSKMRITGTSTKIISYNSRSFSSFFLFFNFFSFFSGFFIFQFLFLLFFSPLSTSLCLLCS